MSRKSKGTIHETSKLAKFFIYIPLVLLTITIIVPVFWVFMASIKENSEFYRNPWALPAGVYFQNFVDAWESANMGSYMLNSVIVTAVAIFLLVIIALPASYVLARFKFKTSKFWNVLFMAGLFINVNYIVVPIFLMLNNGDTFLYKTFGSTFFMNNLFVLAVVYAATALPMAKPSIVTIILFNFLAFWNEYIISMTLLTDPKLKTLPVGLMNLMAAQRSAVQYGKMYAGLVIVMLPTLILYMCVQKKLTQGMTVGGLKG